MFPCRNGRDLRHQMLDLGDTRPMWWPHTHPLPRHATFSVDSRVDAPSHACYWCGINVFSISLHMYDVCSPYYLQISYIIIQSRSSIKKNLSYYSIFLIALSPPLLKKKTAPSSLANLVVQHCTTSWRPPHPLLRMVKTTLVYASNRYTSNNYSPLVYVR